MRRHVVAIIVPWLAGMTLAIAAPVDESRQERRDEIRAVLDHSGLTEVIAQVPLFIEAGMADALKEQHPDMTHEDLVALGDILRQSFAADVIIGETISHMEAHYDPQRIAGVSTHLASPLVQRMTDLEKASSTPPAYDAMMAFAATIEASPPADERLAVLAELDRASHTTELTVTLQVEIFRSIMRVINAYAGEQGGLYLSDEALQNAVLLMQQQLWDEARGMTLLSFLFTYQSVSDAELRDYIRLHDDPDMQWYLALSSSALINALSRAMGNATHGIVRHLKGTERPS